jgi:thioredoxin reductase (NADPH)
MGDGSSILADVVLIATGVTWRKLGASNAERFEGAGVHYVCTVAEAHLYDKRDVAVVGGGNSAGQAAMFLSECCEDRCVHLLVRHKLGAGMSDYLLHRILASKRIKVHQETEIADVVGDKRIEQLKCKSRSGDSFTLPCHAVFAFIGAEPGGDWIPESIQRDKGGYLLTGGEVIQSGHWPLQDRHPCVLETTLPGVLAAGDIRSGSTKRVGFAVADGSLAVTCTHRLLAELRR